METAGKESLMRMCIPSLVCGLLLLVAACDSGSRKTNNNQNNNNTNNINNTNNTNNHQASAIVGQRCPDSERIGLIHVGSYGDGPLQLSGDVQDRPPVRLTDPVLEDGACIYSSERAPGFCEDCPVDRVCTHDSQCVPYPATVAGLRVELRSGSDVQVFSPQYGGGVYGNVTLAGDTFGVKVAWDSGFEVTLDSLQVPAALENLTAVLHGDSMNVESMDFSWTPPSDPAQVYTYIPINHHAGTVTNTQCLLPADAGALHIDGALLRPLAVVTGLEFQELLHARFAAAHVSAGCVEFRFFRSYYPNFQK